MTMQMFAFALLLVSATAQADQCAAGNIDNSDIFDAVGLLQSNTKVVLQADRDKTANAEEVDKIAKAATEKPGKWWKIKPGYCDWHFAAAGKIGVDACGERCKAQADCEVFSYGDVLGCRFSKCGSYPGPNACPSDKQCPVAGQGSGVLGNVYKEYKEAPTKIITDAPPKAPAKATTTTTTKARSYSKIGNGYCDWHYVDAGNIAVDACAARCKAQADCMVFSVGGHMGCRFSKCGSYPGPNACPSSKQCPVVSKEGCVVYALGQANAKYTSLGGGSCVDTSVVSYYLPGRYANTMISGQPIGSAGCYDLCSADAACLAYTVTPTNYCVLYSTGSAAPPTFAFNKGTGASKITGVESFGGDCMKKVA